MKIKYSLTGLALAVLLLLHSCSSTKVVEKWKDPGYDLGPAVNVFVIGILTNRGPRSLVEDAFVNKLRSRGVRATASTAAFPDEAVPPRNIVSAKVKELGSDAVLVVRFMKKETGESHTPGRLYGDQPDFDETWEDVRVSPSDPATPDVSYEFTAAVMRTRFFRAGSEKPVWSLVTETTYQESPFKQIDPFAAVIVRRLAADNMIK